MNPKIALVDTAAHDDVRGRFGHDALLCFSYMDPLHGTHRETTGAGEVTRAAILPRPSVWLAVVVLALVGLGPRTAAGACKRKAGSARELEASGAPGPRQRAVAVRAAGRVVVWGGTDERGNLLGSGARYNPCQDVWSPMSSAGGLPLAVGADAWIIVPLPTGFLTWDAMRVRGAVYDAAADTWTAMATPGAPSARRFMAHAWTGRELMIWGGRAGDNTALGDGARYDPARSAWTPMASAGAPSPRTPMAAWTGTTWVFWAGNTHDANGRGYEPADGARYDPVADRWTAVSTKGAPAGESFAQLQAAGGRVALFLGSDATGEVRRIAFYDPVKDRWSRGAALPASAKGAQLDGAWFGTRYVLTTSAEVMVYDAGKNAWQKRGGAGRRLLPIDAGGRALLVPLPPEQGKPDDVVFTHPLASAELMTVSKGKAVALRRAPARSEALEGMALVWTGSELIAVGGARRSTRIVMRPRGCERPREPGDPGCDPVSAPEQQTLIEPQAQAVGYTP